jgi:hypothetical protein
MEGRGVWANGFESGGSPRVGFAFCLIYGGICGAAGYVTVEFPRYYFALCLPQKNCYVIDIM